MRTAVITILALLLLGCGTSSPSVQEPDAPVPINEQGGEITPTEKAFIAALDSSGILLPDSISVVKDSLAHGYVNRTTAPKTVHLTTQRVNPEAKHPKQFPYLYGRDETPSIAARQAHTIAHEIAHVQSPYLNAEMGRPALGVSLKTSEVQAEILAVVYTDMVFGYDEEDLGYPAKIEYPFVPDKTVKSLKRQYCFIVKRTWNVDHMSCQITHSAR